MITYFAYDKPHKSLTVVPSFSPGVWVHVEKPTEKERAFLVETLHVDKGHLSDALDEDEVPRFEVEGKSLYLFTRFPHLDDDQTTTLPFLLVVTEETVITVSTHNPRFITSMSPSDISLDPSHKERVVIHVLGEITKLYYSYFNTISKEIRQIRRKMEKISNKNIVQFVGFEEILNDFRPSLTGTDNVLRHVMGDNSFSFTSDDVEHIEDIHLSNRQLIDNCIDTIDTIRTIREAYSTILQNNLNNVIKLFTSLTVILTIPTIIASLFGMNVELPLADSPHAFEIVILLIIVIVGGSLFVFRKKDWL